MIDRTKPLTEQDPSDLRVLIDALHGNRERYDRANRIVEARSCELEIAEATRALAILNRRATEAEDQRNEQERNHLLSIRQLVAKANSGGLWSAELATLDRVIAAPPHPALTEERAREVVTEACSRFAITLHDDNIIGAIATRAAKELAGAVVLRERRQHCRAEARAMTAAKLDPALCRRLAGSEDTPAVVAAQLTAAADLAERHAKDIALADERCVKMLAEHRLDLQRIVQLADVLRSAGLEIPAGMPAEQPALTEERVREVVERAVSDCLSMNCAPTATLAEVQVASAVMGKAIATRAAKELAGAVVASGQPVLTADEVRAVLLEAIDWAGNWYASGHIAALREKHAAIADRVADKLAGAVIDPAQREADLREAYLAGARDFGQQVDDATPRETAAAEYARSKAGG